MKTGMLLIALALTLAAQPVPELLFSAKGPIRIGTKTVPVRLVPVARIATPPSDLPPPPFAFALPMKIHLILKGLRAEEPSGLVYHIYLGWEVVPENQEARQSRLLGYFNFYNVDQSRRSLDITAALRNTLPPLDRGLNISILPAGAPEAGAVVVIGGIDLVVTR